MLYKDIYMHWVIWTDFEFTTRDECIDWYPPVPAEYTLLVTAGAERDETRAAIQSASAGEIIRVNHIDQVREYKYGSPF